jgi:hypothetical protein
MPDVPITLTAAEARAFLARHHLLAPPRRLPAEPGSVLAVVDRLGFLQFDPLDIPGARNHELILHARVGGLQRGWLEGWLYGPQRRLIELYNKSLNIVPLAELPHYRIGWDRSARRHGDGILRDQASVAEAILAAIAESGPLSTAAFGEHSHAVDWWWAPIRAARAVAEALFVSGRLGIARREGNRRYYDLIERLVPPEVLSAREPEEEAMRHRLLSRYRAAGLTHPSGATELMLGVGTAPERTRRTAELVEAGRLFAVEVEGLRGPRYAPAEAADLLRRGALGPSERAVAFIAPVDPLVADRRQLRQLWDFEYLWEIYTPAARRRWGYYVLPILWGDRLVGRIEPRLERADRRLRIAGLWWEPGFSVEEPGFGEAFGEALEAYRRFVGAASVRWPPRARRPGHA